MNKSTKIVIWIVVLALAIWGLSSLGKKGASAPASGEPIKIGVIAPLTGTAAIYGEEGKNAILLAFEQINQMGGVNGHPLEAVVEDGKCDGKTAINAWQKLVHGDNIHIILGGHCSTETATIAPQAPIDQVLVLANLTSVSSIPNEGEWVFRNSVPNSYYGQESAKYVYSRGLKNIAIITEKKEFAVDFSDNFKQAFQSAGGKIVYEDGFSPGTNDFRTIVEKLKNQSFDGVVVSTQGPETMGLFVKQMKALDIERPTIFNAAFNSKKLLEASGDYIPPIHFAFVGSLDREAKGAKEFLSAYQVKYGKPIVFNNHLIALVYDMPLRLKAAMESCNGSEDLTCLRNYFKDAKSWDGAAGHIDFGVDHRPMYDLALVQVVNGEEHFQPLKQ